MSSFCKGLESGGGLRSVVGDMAPAESELEETKLRLKLLLLSLDKLLRMSTE